MWTNAVLCCRIRVQPSYQRSLRIVLEWAARSHQSARPHIRQERYHIAIM